MLEVLRIRNFAIIDLAEIRFKNGLNILSGETGAGKSIVIEAISLLLGSRANVDLIRSGYSEAVLEGLFQISTIPWMPARLERFGFHSDTSELLVKRTVHRNGKHRITINGELALRSTLEQICEGLIDLCGQHEHQSLVRPTTQLDLLDRYGGLTESAQAFHSLFLNYRQLKKDRLALDLEEGERQKKKSFLKFQIEEIQSAHLEPGEDTLLQQEKQKLQSTEMRLQIAESVRQALEGEETSPLSSLQLAHQKLKSLVHLDPQTEALYQGIERAKLELEDALLQLSRYLNTLDLNPERLQGVQDRLSFLADLKRKYGTSISEILQTLSSLEKEFSSLDQLESQLGALHGELQDLESHLKRQGQALSKSRRKSADLLSQSVTRELKDLKMSEALFQIELSPIEELERWSHQGADQIQFVVQTNRGEPSRPLAKIASGGELSRLMLAIRRVISNQGGIGVYLFDEIDAGIGGQTAFEVGKKLKSVAAHHQVICITHLPQVAAFADHHLVVHKAPQKEGRTLTEVTALAKTERKKELARMLGGPTLTRKSLGNAQELLLMAAEQSQTVLAESTHPRATKSKNSRVRAEIPH